MSFFDKIISFIKNKKRVITTTTFKTSTTKCAVTGCCTLKLSSKTEELKKEIQQELKTKIKKYINAPEKLLQYLKLKGIKVYRVSNAEKVLAKIGEEEGFITPLKGIKAIILNFFIIKQPGFSTKEIMIFDSDKIEIYTVARAFYKYYSFKKNLPGYDYKSQELFKKVYGNRNNSSAAFENCSLKDVLACKEALARDMESIKFTVELSDEYINAKKMMKKLKESGANI